MKAREALVMSRQTELTRTVATLVSMSRSREFGPGATKSSL